MNPDTNSNSEAGGFSGANVLAKIRRLIPALKKWWWIPVLFGAVGGGGMAMHLVKQPPPNFVTTAEMWISGKIRLTDTGNGSFSEEFGTFYGTTIAH